MEASRSISAAAPSCSCPFPNFYNKDCFLRLESGKSCILSHPSKDVLIRTPTAFCLPPPPRKPLLATASPKAFDSLPGWFCPFSVFLPLFFLGFAWVAFCLTCPVWMPVCLPLCNSLPSSLFLLVSICWTNFEWPAFERLDVPFESKHDQAPKWGPLSWRLVPVSWSFSLICNSYTNRI